MDRRETETHTLHTQEHKSDTMSRVQYVCCECAVGMSAVYSDLDGVRWTPQSGEGSTVVVHHADSTHWYTLKQTESGQLTPAITQHTVLTK